MTILTGEIFFLIIGYAAEYYLACLITEMVNENPDTDPGSDDINCLDIGRNF